MLKYGMTMTDLAKIAGVPDDLDGSGYFTFTYHLGDNSDVVLSAASEDRPILYARHRAAQGGDLSLLPGKE
jgi:hypothetical protein